MHVPLTAGPFDYTSQSLAMSAMSEKNEKDNAGKVGKSLKDRPDKKPSVDDYKSEDKDEIVEERLE